MAEITDIYWTIEYLLIADLRRVVYHDSSTGRELGTWITELNGEALERKLQEHKQALINSFNGLGMT